MATKQTNNILKFPTVLVGIFAHEDDEVAGAGGILTKNVRLGGKSHVICFGGSTDLRTQEFKNACEKMGVSCELLGKREGNYDDKKDETINLLRDLIIKYKPEFVITHRKEGDYNRDHRVVSELVRDAVIKAHIPFDGHVVKGIFYTECHSLHSIWHIMVDTTEDYERIREAFNCHKSQIDKLDGYYLKMLDARSKLRGVQAGCEKAEAFVYEPLPFVGGLNRRILGE